MVMKGELHRLVPTTVKDPVCVAVATSHSARQKKQNKCRAIGFEMVCTEF
jgi:hypothetical protein